jgi:N-acetylmuramoyl-L-alanine amidase
MRLLSIRPYFLFLVLTFAVLCAWQNSAYALSINGVRFGSHPDKQRVVIELSDKIEFRAFTMSSPSRLVVDMPRFTFNAKDVNRPTSSLVTDMRHGPVGKNMARLVLQTSHDISIQSAFALPKDNTQPNRIVIDFVKSDSVSDSKTQTLGTLKNIPPSQEPKTEATDDDSKNSSTNSSPRIKGKPVIIIDPGHGGPDSGAVSVIGTYEKNIVLAVGKELKKMLEDSGQYTVKMTRSTDVFIPLRDRVRFARKHNGDLFLSLHADSIGRSDVRGASVYTLSEKASDKEAEKLAERENKSDLIAGVNLNNQEDDVTSILIDLASRETMNQSKFLANTVVRNLDDHDVDILARSPHRSAGFAVLKALDIPSALVEMGYLTNAAQAEQLNSPEHRRKIARALKASIDDYFTRVAKLQGQ